MATIINSLNKLHNKFDGINVDLYKEKEALFSRMEIVEDTIESTADDTETLKFDFAVMKGIIQKQEKDINDLKVKVLDLTVRQMSVNVVKLAYYLSLLKRMKNMVTKRQNRALRTVMIQF